jgi:hypothetical protein
MNMLPLLTVKIKSLNQSTRSLERKATDHIYVRLLVEQARRCSMAAINQRVELVPFVLLNVVVLAVVVGVFSSDRVYSTLAVDERWSFSCLNHWLSSEDLAGVDEEVVEVVAYITELVAGSAYYIEALVG